MKLELEDLKVIAKRVFETHNVDECFVTTDGMPFLKKVSADNHCCNKPIKVEVFSRKEVCGKKEDRSQKPEVITTSDEAIGYLKKTEIDKMDYPAMKALVDLLQLKPVNNKKDSLIAILTDTRKLLLENEVEKEDQKEEGTSGTQGTEEKNTEVQNTEAGTEEKNTEAATEEK